MRQPILLSCALLAFAASFAAAYLSFRTSAPQVKALIGGGMFLLAALGTLWKDFALLTFTRKVR